jgi:hypothetical protein
MAHGFLQKGHSGSSRIEVLLEFSPSKAQSCQFANDAALGLRLRSILNFDSEFISVFTLVPQTGWISWIGT